MAFSCTRFDLKENLEIAYALDSADQGAKDIQSISALRMQAATGSPNSEGQELMQSAITILVITMESIITHRFADLFMLNACKRKIHLEKPCHSKAKRV